MQARRCGALRRQGTGSSCLLKAGHGNDSIFFTYATGCKVLVMKLALGTEELALGESAEQILEAPGAGS